MPKAVCFWRLGIKIGVLAVLCLSGLITTPAETPDFPERMPIVERPFPEDPDKFSFAIIGDKTGGGLDKWPVFDRAVAEINLLEPDFAIMVGDLIQGDTENVDTLKAEWAEFWQHESGLNVPFLPLPGNHDITNRVMYEYWRDTLGRTYSTFTYKNCLFILLNTEERHNPVYTDRNWAEGWFGAEQTRYAVDALERHRNVRHTFVLLHRPVWLYENSGWAPIEAALGDRAYTVFAGHHHNLTLHTRDDRRYFVLGATGGGLAPKDAPEAGAFDHYSIVTVEGEEAGVAIIKPGNVYPADISTADFKARLSELLTFKTDFNHDRTEPLSNGILEITIENRLEKRVAVEVGFHENETWQPAPHRSAFTVEPGKTARGIVRLTTASDTLLPFPIYDYAILYGGEQIKSGRNLFNPINSSEMRVLKNWMLLGPFELGTTEPSSDTTAIPPSFQTSEPPSVTAKDTGNTADTDWQEHRSETDRINVDAAFGEPDRAFGYGVTHIRSPDARTVFAQIRWGCDLGRLFLNGVAVPGAGVPGASLFRGRVHLELRLKAGWNVLTVQSGDYNGAWDFQLEIADGKDELQFRAHPPTAIEE